MAYGITEELSSVHLLRIPHPLVTPHRVRVLRLHLVPTAWEGEEECVWRVGEGALGAWGGGYWSQDMK